MDRVWTWPRIRSKKSTACAYGVKNSTRPETEMKYLRASSENLDMQEGSEGLAQPV